MSLQLQAGAAQISLAGLLQGSAADGSQPLTSPDWLGLLGATLSGDVWQVILARE